MRSADLTAAEIGHVNAHAAGSVEDDATEATAIRAVLGDVPVTAPKSFFGHLGASGGAVEMVASLLALKHGEIPVTLNYDQPDPHCPVHVVRHTGYPRRAAHRDCCSASPTPARPWRSSDRGDDAGRGFKVRRTVGPRASSVSGGDQVWG